jgi:Leucine-rich repeat (LRR) protein
LPPTLTHLYCEHNQLTYLPELPLTLIYCNDNQLTYLPELPLTLTKLVC